jgi:NADH-quinone oxidoreductase subunit J
MTGRAPRAALLALAVLLLFLAGARAASAQEDAPAPAAAAAEPGGEPGPTGPAQSGGFENGRAAAFLFWLLALATVGGSLFVITRRNLVAAVMGMVGTFFALAALYAMLYAHFLAAIQVLVYAGAIMVLFVFVVMILNRPEEEPWALQGLLGKALAGLALLYLLVRVSGVLWGVKDTPHAAVAGPRPQAVDTTRVGVLEHPSQSLQRVDDWGSTRSVGKALFRDYLFPFEAVSLVLLVAVVGGIALSRPHRAEREEKPDPGAGATP